MEKINKNLPLIASALIIITLLFFSQVFSEDFQLKIINVFRFPLKIISGSYYALRDISNFSRIKMENKVLRENIASLEKGLLDLREANFENERLRQLLGFQEAQKNKYISAMVIARDPSVLKDTIIIDKGRRHGLSKDMTVISGNGLVGRIRECGVDISRCLLITDRDSVVSAIVQRTREEGACVGGARSGLLLKYLELGSDVKEGDAVISSGFSGVFEKGILIGGVAAVKKDPSGLYLNAVVKPAVDMTRLEEVLVIR